METMKQIEIVDGLLSSLKVSGDDVFILAQARTELKKAYDSMKEPQDKAEGDKFSRPVETMK